MVARTPPKQKKMVAPLNPTLLRETVNKVDKCMARLQELQYTVAGGAKVISGVSLSPRSTRVYLRTSLRCKQESLRIKNANPRKSSPPGKLPTNTGDWRRMSLPAMLLGETVGEIMQASQFAREIVSVASKMKKLAPCSDDPKTPPVTIRRKQRPNPEENSEIRARRKREKQITLQTIRSESDAPTLHRARSRINFKVVSPPKRREQEKRENNANPQYLTNRVSPRNRPWAKKAVLFPNPLFHSSPTSHHHKFGKTKSPIISRNHRQTTPHKFLIKSPSSVKIKSPTHSVSPKRNTSLSRKSPKMSTAAKIRRSFSPSRLANRLASPLKGGRKSVQKSAGGVMSGLKQRPTSIPMTFSTRRAPF